MSDLEIHCEHKPSPAKLDVLHVDHWPVWKKEVSEFPWHYDKAETCYVVRGRFIVTPEGEIANDPTLELLSRTAVSQARAGADLVDGITGEGLGEGVDAADVPHRCREDHDCVPPE